MRVLKDHSQVRQLSYSRRRHAARIVYDLFIFGSVSLQQEFIQSISARLGKRTGRIKGRMKQVQKGRLNARRYTRLVPSSRRGSIDVAQRLQGG
jgi:predicted transposase YdaD